MEELRSLDLLATPDRPRVRDLEYDDLGKLQYLSCAIKVRDCLVMISAHCFLLAPSSLLPEVVVDSKEILAVVLQTSKPCMVCASFFGRSSSHVA